MGMPLVVFSVVLSALPAAPPTPASAVLAPPSVAATVRSYFEALIDNNSPRALGLTVGKAKSHTQAILDRLRDEARRAHAAVDLRLRSLEIKERSFSLS